MNKIKITHFANEFLKMSKKIEKYVDFENWATDQGINDSEDRKAIREKIHHRYSIKPREVFKDLQRLENWRQKNSEKIRLLENEFSPLYNIDPLSAILIFAYRYMGLSYRAIADLNFPKSKSSVELKINQAMTEIHKINL